MTEPDTTGSEQPDRIVRIEGSSLRPPGAAAVIEAVHAAMQAESVPYVIVGAAGRDLVLEHVYGLSSPTATRDVDVGVMVRGWDAYEALRARLGSTHGYTKTATPYRLRAPEGLLVDLIPFGGIEEPEGKVSVPPRHTQVMVTLGFAEAHESALLVEVDGTGPVRVVSPAGMSMLKLLAWRDRREPRDAEDLAFLMSIYYDLQGEGVYLRHADLFDEDDFTVTAASARVLGRDAGLLSRDTEPLHHAILTVLDEQTDETNRTSPLAAAMGRRYVTRHDDRVRCLAAYARGYREGTDL